MTFMKGVRGPRGLAGALNSYGNLTLAKDFSVVPVGEASAARLAADFSLGSAVATITASRGASNPATYIDEYGIIRVVTNSNTGRITAGFYNTTGFVRRTGLLIERASTNILIRTDGTAESSGFWTGWGVNSNVTGTPTRTQVAAPTGIPGSYAQRIQYTGIATDTGKVYGMQPSAFSTAGSVAQGDVLTVSIWARSQTGNSGFNINMQINIADSSSVFLEEFTSPALTLDTTWRRYTFTATVAHASASRARIRFGEIGGSIHEGDTLDFEVYAPQLEKQPYATSFIPTTTAALTRNGEKLTYLNASNYPASEKTLFFRASTEGTGSYRSFFDQNMSAGDWLGVVIDEDDISYAYCAGTATGAAFAQNTSIVLAGVVQHASPRVSLYHNGAAVGTPDTTAWTEPTLGTDSTYFAEEAGTGQMDGIAQAVAIYSGAKSAADVLAISNLMGAS